jgi:hypothetical protein
MKKIILLLSFLLANEYLAHGQNWQTVPVNDTNWFVVNETPLLEEGQLRVVWLDSSNVNGNLFEGSFCRSLRPFSDGCFDTLGSSWMGKRYLHNMANGDEYFFNLVGDTSLLKTLAQVSDTWLMATDSLGIEFQATVYADATMMIDNVLDSIKYISIQAFQGAVPITHDCNDTLILSKNHGFIRTPEWYSFPYAIPWSWTTFLHRSFFIGQNRLSKAKVMASLNETKSKYTAGNEWITEYTQSPFNKTIKHDSIISVIDTSIGYRVNFVRKQKVIDLVTLVETNSINQLSELKDTTSYVANSIYKLFPEYMGFEFNAGFPTFLNSYVHFIPTKYTISNACNGTIKVEKDLGGYYMGVHDVGGCYVGSVPLGDPPVLILTEEEVLGRRTLVESIGSIFPLDTFTHLYYNINGCLLGTKINFIVGVDEFKFDGYVRLGRINLNWKTLNERNVHRFEIQRKIPDAHFETVGEVKSLGDNPLTNEYSFQDPITTQMQDKELQYRIKMIDHDGKAMYSNVIYLNTKVSNVVRVYPIPFKDYLQLDGLSMDTEYQFELVDMTGRLMFKSMLRTAKDGHVTLHELDVLKNGSYILFLSSEKQPKIHYRILKF